jgi:hypothetical protein
MLAITSCAVGMYTTRDPPFHLINLANDNPEHTQHRRQDNGYKYRPTME